MPDTCPIMAPITPYSSPSGPALVLPFVIYDRLIVNRIGPSKYAEFLPLSPPALSPRETDFYTASA